MKSSRLHLPSVLALLVCAACDPAARGQATVASVDVVRPAVEAEGPGGGHAVSTRERLGAGTELRVSERAQALLRHDHGARLLLDGGSRLVVEEGGARLVKGRVWVDAGAGAQVAVAVGGVLLSAGGQGAGFEMQVAPERSTLTVVRGEVAWRAGAPEGARGVVRAGEMASLGKGIAEVAPVVLWDDWTGGLGWPDPRRSRGAAGLGEIGARRPGDLGEARFPLSIQRLQVRTRIEDDLAVTTVEQTFFNPAESTLEGIYRVRIPEGAILSRFAIDRRGRFVDGYVKERETARKQYQEQVYQGSTHDPALLEWEAPGSYRARLYPLPPGSTRRVLITYSEWLPAYGQDDTLRVFRYPMAAGGEGAPIIQELDVEIDATRSGATEVRAGLGALLSRETGRIVLQRTDYLPTADLVVELSGARRPADVARGYRAPHEVPQRPGGPRSRAEDDYVLIQTEPVPAPAASTREPIDVVLLVDLSAATDATHVAMARTLAEALLRHLSPEDRVTLLGADLDLHAVGPEAPAGKAPRPLPPLEAATSERVERLLQGLMRASTGGATDLGAIFSQAQALLDPERLGGVVYVGDAQPTVGELDLPSLRERLDRLPAPLRLYGVGVGAEADLGLLAGLCQVSAGQAYRIADRAAAAETALSIITHLSRPAASRVVVDAGPDVDRVYPRQPVSVLSGEPLTVLARVRKRLPAVVSVDGLLRGKPFHRSFKVVAHKIEDTADLRLRWSQARLQQLLQSGASTEEVAELGVRQDLITPFTSFYVPSEDEVGQLLQKLPDVRPAGCSSRPSASAVSVSAEAPAAQPPPPHSSSPAGAPAQMAQMEQAQKQMADEQRRVREEGSAGESRKAKKASRNRAAMDPSDPLAGLGMDAPAPTTAASAPEKPMAPARTRGGDDFKADKNTDTGTALGKDAAPVIDGLVGAGPGGGGTGEGTIGLGNLGAIGHGGQRGEAGSYGIKGGKLRGRRAQAPEVVPGTAEVRGSLNKEIIRRIIRRHINEVKFCYERELTSNQALQGRVAVQFTIGTDGAVSASAVQSSTLGNPGVEGCVAAAVQRWEFPKPRGGAVVVTYPFEFRSGGGGEERVSEPIAAAAVTSGNVTVLVGIIQHRPSGCSAASKQPLDERIELWRERLAMGGGVRRAQEVFQDAAQGCELPRWTDRRELLRLMLRSCLHSGGPAAMVELHRHFAESPEEQDFLRRAILGEVKTPRDLRVVYDGLGLLDEERATLVQEVVQGAKSLPDRLRRIDELLGKWPGDLRLKLARMEAQELLGDKEAARRSAEDVRQDPYADAQARTAVGELYLRLGDIPAARRAFSEIVEFAPHDPLARRRLGDLYRAHQWFEEAYRQYQTLLGLLPGDLSVLLLQAAAAAGAGHIEEALGLEGRVAATAEPGSETGLSRVALLWTDVRLLLLRDEARKRGDNEELARLVARARRSGVTGLARPVRVLLTWAHPEADLELHVAAPGEALGSATELAPQFGLLGWQSARDDKTDRTTGPYQIEVRRGGGASAALTHEAELLVVTAEGEPGERLFRLPLRMSADQPVRRLVLRDNQLQDEAQP